jgi:hypothetical protein
MPAPDDNGHDSLQDEPETGAPPDGPQHREREGPPDEDDDKMVDEDSEESFPATDPPAHY